LDGTGPAARASHDGTSGVGDRKLVKRRRGSGVPNFTEIDAWRIRNVQNSQGGDYGAGNDLKNWLSKGGSLLIPMFQHQEDATDVTLPEFIETRERVVSSRHNRRIQV